MCLRSFTVGVLAGAILTIGALEANMRLMERKIEKRLTTWNPVQKSDNVTMEKARAAARSVKEEHDTHARTNL